MTIDAFEQRAASAGSALREAFFVPAPAPHAVGPGTTVVRVRVRPPAARAPRRAAVAAALLATAAVVVGAFTLVVPRPEPVDVLGSARERDRAVLAPPYLVGAGTLDADREHSVQRFPVPFTLRVPAVDPAAEWSYRTGRTFDVGVDRSGVVLLAPVDTYEPDRTWQGQTRLVPAPTDATGWEQWLARTGYVDVLDRRQVVVGGAAATRFRIQVADLPSSYDQCGGGRRCLAVQPMDDPQVGPGRPGTGPQAGLDATSVEVTVIELGDRAVLAVTGAQPEDADDWLPTARRLIDSLRFA